jgi:hypothetical protein
MHHQDILVLEGVAVTFGYLANTGRANMRDETARLDFWRQIPEVSVTPRGIYRNESDGFIIYLGYIPSDPEPVSIERFLDLAGVYALVDKGIFRLIQQLIDDDGRTQISEEATHR